MDGAIQAERGKGEGSVWRSRGAQMGGNPRQELLGVEGLGHIVHRAASQERHLVLHVALGAEDDDGNAVDLRQHRLAGKPRQHQIQ